MNRTKPDTPELFRRITELSTEADWTVDETREVLLDAGLQPDDFGEQMLQLVSRLKKESSFHWKNAAHALRRNLLDKIRSRVVSETRGLTRPQLLGKLNEALERLPRPVAEQYGVAFRKFEDANEDDIRSMLEEIALIEDLEQGER